MLSVSIERIALLRRCISLVRFAAILATGCVITRADVSIAVAGEPLRFNAEVISEESEFCAAAVMDVNGDKQPDILSGGWWYEAPNWQRHKLREVERIGTRFDDYSNLPMDVDGDGDLDLISVNYRSKSIYWVRNPGPGPSAAGTEWTRIMIDTPGPSETGRLVDIDGDGTLDILPNGTTFAAWYSLSKPSGEANSSTWIRHDLPEQLAGHGIGSGDINGDGRMDLVNPNGWAEAPANPRMDRWTWHADFKLFRDCSVPILVMDVDGDGDQDLVWGRGHNVGLYWTEQQSASEPKSSKALPAIQSPSTDSSVTPDLLRVIAGCPIQGQRTWITHAIDTSWSCAHAPLVGDLDGDGIEEVIMGKRFQGHEGKDPGENEPLGVFSYQFDRKSRTWSRRMITQHPLCGLDLDPKCTDIDNDGDLDLICPARSGLVLLRNLHKGGKNESDATSNVAARLLPEGILHNDFSMMRVMEKGNAVQRPIATALDMGRRRAQIHQQMEQVMGVLPGPEDRVPLNVEITSIEEAGKYTRIKLTYAADRMGRVPAYLLIPHGLTAPATGMLCLHPTQFELGKAQLLGLGGKPSRFYAHELAARGFVCIVPDYPGFGEYKVDFQELSKQYASGTMKAIWDNIRALDLLESLPCVKHDSIGCLGHSLGGHNALYTAAFDVRVRAVMSSCGFNAFEDYYGGNLKGWTSDRYMPRIATVYGSDPKQMPFDFPEVLAAIAPRPLLVNAPLRDSNFAVVGVRKCQAAVEPVYKLLGKSDKIRFLYPDDEHDFPEAIRMQTYEWFAKELK